MTSNMKKGLGPGKPAFKFKFTVVPEYLELRLKKDWRPKNLELVWSRGQRQRNLSVSKEVLTYKTANVDDIECDIGNVAWDRGISSTLLVTLYKSSEASVQFLKKEYVFALVDNRGLNRRKLAIFPLNIAEYASLTSDSTPLEMEFRTLSNKTTMVTAGLHIECQFVKKGTSNDDDMISNFSHVSDDDEEYRRMTLSTDQENNPVFEFHCPLQQQHNNLSILQARAQQTKSQLLLDLNIAEKSDLKHLGTLDRGSPNGTPIGSQEDLQNGIGNEPAFTIPEPDYSPDLLVTEKKKRHRVSAVILDDVTDRVATVVDRKTSKGNVFSTLKSGVRAMLQGRKGSLSSDPDLDSFSDAMKYASLPVSSMSQSPKFVDDEEARRVAVQILKLETRNQELCRQCGNLENENALLRRDREELQTEVSELQLLVEDLRNRLVHAEADRTSKSAETDKFFEKLNLKGWLCKRGVKGGLIGKRWQRRWFSMDSKGYLYYYKSNNNNIPRGFIAVDFILGVEDVFPSLQDKNNASFNVITDGRVFELMAHDQEEKEKWINALDFIRSWRSQMSNVTL